MIVASMGDWLVLVIVLIGLPDFILMTLFVLKYFSSTVMKTSATNMKLKRQISNNKW